MNTVLSRFDAKTAEADNGCLRWTAAIGGNGYGRFFPAKGVGVSAHRYAFERSYGPIPPGMVIDHVCRNRACVNPDHLRAVTQRENLLAEGSESPAAVNASRTHCARGGHPFEGDNLMLLYRRGGVERRCRACDKERKRRAYARRQHDTT